MTKKTWPGALALLLSLGCAGGLEDPDRFLPGTCPDGLDVEAEILVPRCGVDGCHAGATPQADLDLQSADARMRLFMIEATSSCAGEALLDPLAPTQSVLYRKVAGTTCGSRMPSIGTLLTPDEIDCVRLWIAETSTSS